MRRLQIYESRERALVRAADMALAPLGWVSSRGDARAEVRRVLLLRLERIGDLLMVLDAIRDARAAWPAAEIDLAVGSWNAPLARLIPEITSIDVADAPWLSRGAGTMSWSALIAHARGWRRRQYDLVVNFEPDIRSNGLAWLSGAPRRVGYWSAGGGALLTDALEYAPAAHVSENARVLIASAAGRDAAAPSRARITPELEPPADATARAAERLGPARGPLIGVHVNGGRESKQWHLDRFARVARELAGARGATIVLTGSDADRPMVDVVKRDLANVRVVDASGGMDVPTLAALLARLDLFITSDTGPMHLAAAMGTPVVALFGPAQPERYGPRALLERIVRVDLPCSPCGRVRLPPERCRGHVPDCMDGITVSAVLHAANELLDAARPAAGRAATS
jgi:lipopolysaccharide heptosyltransferase II